MLLRNCIITCYLFFMWRYKKLYVNGRDNWMKPKSVVVLLLGITLSILSIIVLISSGHPVAIIPLIFGISFLWLGWWRGRSAYIVFGHAFIILGCFLITWGIYLLPISKPVLSHIFGRPLFWGIFSLMGGICSNYHGFCQCIHNQK